MITQKEFRASEGSKELNNFLMTTTGRQLMELLRKEARPKKATDAKQMASGNDFVVQLALAGQYRIAQQEMIDLIELLSEPPDAPAPVDPEKGFELEPEEP